MPSEFVKCPNCGFPWERGRRPREIEKCPDLDKKHCSRCCPWQSAKHGLVFTIVWPGTWHGWYFERVPLRFGSGDDGAVVLR